MSILPATVSSCGKPVSMTHGNDTVALRKMSRGDRYDVKHLKSRVSG
jgi:hypothetical protein